MAKTLTGELAQNMASARRSMNDTVKAMAHLSKLAAKKHDAIVDTLKGLYAQQTKDPDNEDLAQKIKGLELTKRALYAASEYGQGIHQQVKGERPKVVTPSHTTKDHNGKFTQKGSYNHFLGSFHRAVKKVFAPDATQQN